MAAIELPYGLGRLLLTIPYEWLGEIAEPKPIKAAPDPDAMIRAALRRPVGCRPLGQLVERGRRMAVLVDDYTRKTPVAQFLPLVLEELRSAGVAQDDILLVVALGTHRPMTRVELDAKLGPAISRQYRVINTPSTNDAEMVFLGTSSAGIPAWVNRWVADADIRIGLGMITPHMDAGFSGGAKIVLPGVCSSRTVDAFHAASAFLPYNQLGNVRAPLRRNLEQFVAEQVPLHFIVNVILTTDGKLYQCVTGHPVKAHRAGVRYARAVFGTRIRKRYPVVVANCYPYDVDWWQSSKGVWGGDRMTADGGTLIILTAAPEGNSSYPLVPGYIGRDPEELKHEIASGLALDAKQAATGALFGMLRRRINLVLCSRGLSPADAEAMRMPYYVSVDRAVSDSVARLPEHERRHSVGVAPQAGILLPMEGCPAGAS